MPQAAARTIDMSQLKKPITVYLPDTRGVEINRFGCGNLKLGFGVFTYSRFAGKATPSHPHGTCPGSTEECEAICYAKRISGAVPLMVYNQNMGADVPPIPDDCQVLRIHVSGDFDSIEYIQNWVMRLQARPDVTAWAYTRSWRVPSLLLYLEMLRALPNVQLFASMDQSHTDVPPHGWRRAWIDGDKRAGDPFTDIMAHDDAAALMHSARNQRTFDGAPSLVCPEETKHKANCLECGYCFEGKRNDVTFLRH
jgi:hypothetical protein